MEREFGQPVRGVLYNIIQKPSIRRKKQESIEAFVDRLEEFYRDEHCFDRQQLIIDHGQHQAVERHLWTLAEEYKRAQDRRDRSLFYQNPGACYLYNRPCEYYALCSSGESQVTRENLYEEKEPHEELVEDKGPVF